MVLCLLFFRNFSTYSTWFGLDWEDINILYVFEFSIICLSTDPTAFSGICAAETFAENRLCLAGCDSVPVLTNGHPGDAS